MHPQAVSFNILDKPLQAILDQIQEECEKMQTNTNKLRCLTCGALCAINMLGNIKPKQLYNQPKIHQLLHCPA